MTPEVAIRIGKLFGNGPGLWLNLQQKYDLWRAEKKLAKQVAKIPTLEAAARIKKRPPAASPGLRGPPHAAIGTGAE